VKPPSRRRPPGRRGLPEKKARSDHWETPGVLLPKANAKARLKERLRESEVDRRMVLDRRRFIAGHSAPVALRDGISTSASPAIVHYELDESRRRNLTQTKTRFGGKPFADNPVAWAKDAGPNGGWNLRPREID